MGPKPYLAALLALLFCASTTMADDLTAMSDEFDDPASLQDWTRLRSTEGWTYDPWQTVSVGRSMLTITPKSSAAYMDHRPPFLYKEVEGDFVLTAQVNVTNRAGDGPPDSAWSLAGLMARRPRTDVPAAREADGENYVLMSLGAAARAGRYNVEMKSTRGSRGNPQSTDWAGDGRATLRMARVGGYFLLLARPVDGDWVIVGRDYRPDLPQRLQVGLYAVTDWNSVQNTGAEAYNRAGVAGAGNPDLRLQVYSVTFAEPQLPGGMRRINWRQEDEVSNIRLLEIFGDAPRVPGAVNTNAELRPPVDTTPARPRLPEPPVATAPATPTAGGVPSGEALTALSDEFNDGRTLRNWKRLYQTEPLRGESLEGYDISRTRRGHMFVMPYAISWYNEYRGNLIYKDVDGDLAVTARIQVQRRGGGGAPRSNFSLVGIMFRTARDITADTWTPNGENYVFLSVGTSDQPGTFQLEVKGTHNSRSRPEFSAGQGEALLRVVRAGSAFIMMYRYPNGEWQIRRRYNRPDMTGPIQAGLTTYTDYSAISRVDFREHNTSVLRGVGRPDIEGYIDWIRYKPVTIPSALQGRDLANDRQVTDAQLIAAFGRPLD